MRRPALHRAFALVVLCSSAAAQPSAIQGTVVDQVSGAPLDRVHLTFLSGSGGQPEQPYGAISDKTGHFSITVLPPGRYAIELNRNGYMQIPSEDGLLTSVVLKASQPIADLKLEMAPSAMVSGRVVDQFGDPVEHSDVLLVPITNSGRSSSGESNTDERGEFRIVAGPGKFYLQANPSRHYVDLAETRTDSFPELEYGKTYFPDAASKDRASVIEVTAGHDVDGLEIHLVSAAAQRRFTISGTVTNLPEDTPAFVRASPVDVPPNGPNMGFIRSGGIFSLPGLAPGTYDLIVTVPGNDKLRGGARVSVAESDLGNVEVALGPPPELTGTVDLADAPQAKRTVRLAQASSGIDAALFDTLDQFGPVGAVSPEGTFRISGFEPGHFRPVVDPMPENGYISSVELNGSLAAGEIITLSAADQTPRLKITVARDGATLTGQVLAEDGDPPPGNAGVLLLANPNFEGARLSQLKDGKYEFRAFRPGKYRLALIRETDLFADDRSQLDAVLREAFEAAEEIEIAPGARITKDIHARDLHAKP